MTKRAHIYIDGFNLYYGAVRETSYKWHDVVALGKHFLKGCNVQKTKYFTAKVSEMGDPDRPTRQQVFWCVLKEMYKDEFEIIKDYFRIDQRRLPRDVRGKNRV